MSVSSRAPTAWIMSQGNAIHLSAYQDCKVVILPQRFLPMPVSFAYPKNSSLAIIIDHQFRKLQETGVQTRIQKKYTPLAPECRHSLSAHIFWALVLSFSFQRWLLHWEGGSEHHQSCHGHKPIWLRLCHLVGPVRHRVNLLQQNEGHESLMLHEPWRHDVTLYYSLLR